MALFEHDDVRDYIKELLSKRPRGGRGELRLIADKIGAHTTLISQILSGSRSFTEDQGFDLCSYFELSEVEAEYLQLLVRIERASTVKYRNFLKQKLTRFRQETEKISKRFTTELELSDSQRAIFYSSWIYSAIRIFCGLSESGQTLEDIMNRFSLNRIKAVSILNFLVESQICSFENDRYKNGRKRTYVDRGSIYFQKHHSNWRLKSIERSENITDDDRLYTVTMGIAEKDYQKLKDEVTKLLSSFSKILEKSEEPDQLVCFNCDLFKV